MQIFFRTFLWSNSSVKVTIVASDESDLNDYTIQYATNSNGFGTYNSDGETVTQNNTTVRAQITDGTNTSEEISETVDNIDKENPTVKDVSSTGDSVTFSAEDDLSGLKEYIVTTSASAPSVGWTSVEPAEKSLKNITVYDLDPGTTYYIWVRDQANNVNGSESIDTFVLEANLMAESEDNVGGTWGEIQFFFNTGIERSAISMLHLHDSIPSQFPYLDYVWDVSEQRNRGVIAWVSEIEPNQDYDGAETYVMNVGSRGKIKANLSCKLLFKGVPIDVSELQFLDTTGVTSFERCFEGSDLTVRES